MLKIIIAVAAGLLMGYTSITQLNINSANAGPEPITPPVSNPLVCETPIPVTCHVGSKLVLTTDANGCQVYNCDAEGPKFTIFGFVRPDPAELEQTVWIASGVETSEATRATVVVSVYDPSGNLVVARQFSNQEMQSGSINYVYQFPWTVPANAPIGLYVTKVAIYGSDNQLLYLNDKATMFNLTDEASPTPSPASTSNNPQDGSLSYDPVPAPVCNDAKPGSAPTLLYAEASGNNQVTLTWTEAQDPVTYYLVAYGYSGNQIMFGNPNIGGKGTTTYVVSGLSGGSSYYFRVRAGNGCMPGDFSNGLAVSVPGPILNPTSSGFDQSVLGTSTEMGNLPSPTPSPSDNNSSLLVTPHQDTSTDVAEANIFIRIWNFILHLFGH